MKKFIKGDGVFSTSHTQNLNRQGKVVSETRYSKDSWGRNLEQTKDLKTGKWRSEKIDKQNTFDRSQKKSTNIKSNLNGNNKGWLNIFG
jgi:hypothetical protein